MRADLDQDHQELIGFALDKLSGGANAARVERHEYEKGSPASLTLFIRRVPRAQRPSGAHYRGAKILNAAAAQLEKFVSTAISSAGTSVFTSQIHFEASKVIAIRCRIAACATEAEFKLMISPLRQVFAGILTRRRIESLGASHPQCPTEGACDAAQ